MILHGKKKGKKKKKKWMRMWMLLVGGGRGIYFYVIPALVIWASKTIRILG